MKPNTSTDTMTLTRGVEEAMLMTIDTSSAGMVHLMNMLTNLYTDQITAVIREYSTNALDSHIDAGLAEPIRVTLPTREDPNFRVRDYGLGLNADELRNIYSTYGRSTKRQSDDVNGMLGFGCKSALTYAASFQVIATKDGVRLHTVVAKNDDGVGSINVLSQERTTDRNGVTIVVPVQARDITAFAEKAAAFYKYWEKGTVLVDGKAPKSERDRKDVLWIDEHTFVSSDRYRDNNDIVVMGNVPYPIKGLDKGDYHCAVTAWISMGDVEFTPSREGLKDKAPTTVATTKELSKHVQERLWPTLQRVLDASSTTPFDRLKKSEEWSTLLGYRWAEPFKPVLPDGKSVWYLRHNYDVERRAERTDGNRITQHLLDDDRTYVLVDYPYSAVSGSIKRRLQKVAAMADGVSVSVSVPWLLLPEGTEAPVLEGRDKVVKYDDLPEPDKSDRPERVKREGPYKYTVIRHASGLSEESATFTGPIAYGVPSKSRWSSEQSTLRTYAQTLGYDYVELTPRQVEKFTRNHPQAVEVTAAYHAKRDAAGKALTADDKAAYKLHSQYGRMLAGFERHLPLILDPDFCKLVNMSGSVTSNARLQEAIKYGVSIDTYGGGNALDTIACRYPLVAFNRGLSDSTDVVLYMNAKYISISNNNTTP